MGLIKLAVYGAIGYLVYQTFFADMPGSRGGRGGGSSAGKKLGDAARGAARGVAESFGGQQGGQQGGPSSQSAGGTRMTGRGGGMPEQTEEMTGTSASHRVGRGVT